MSRRNERLRLIRDIKRIDAAWAAREAREQREELRENFWAGTITIVVLLLLGVFGVIWVSHC
jgi:hypothetical protein